MARGPRKGPSRDEPRLRTVEIVKWLWRTSPERFTANDIAKQYGITRGESYRRIQYMKVYGLVTKVGEAEAHRAGRREIVYALTRWGRKYSEDQSKKRG